MGLFSEKPMEIEIPVGLGKTLEAVAAARRKGEAIRMEGRVWSYQELDEQANRVAGGLASLGIGRGDRVAMMLPNIPEFVFTFFGIQKLGAVAVPFNTMYKGREISHILQDSGARAIICLTSFSNLINEIKTECPALEHVIVTGQRTLVFLDPDASVNIQLVLESQLFSSEEEAFYALGEVLVECFTALGVADAWYKHQGVIRASGKKLALILLREIEGLYIFNVMTFLERLDTDPLFKVVYVPPEIKERAVEPMTSVAEESGAHPSLEEFRDVFLETLSERLGITVESGSLTRDELLAYEKNRALATRIT
ncbi:MAG: AMP-binding protein [Spirochaetaceae bacterium]